MRVISVNFFRLRTKPGRRCASNPFLFQEVSKEDRTMRRAKVVVIAVVAMGIAALGGTAPTKAGEPKAEKPGLRVGVFDSRAVAVAYVHGTKEPGYRPHLQRL